MLRINGMEYRRGDQTLFPKIDIEVKPGEIKAIQSTVNIRAVLLQMIIGKENVRNGSIQIQHQTLQEDRQKYVSSLGVCWYEEGIYERLKVQEYLKFIGSLYQSKASIKEVLLQIQLEEKARLKMHQLNRSEKRRVQFGRILMQEAEVVIFEEPGGQCRFRNETGPPSICRISAETAKSGIDFNNKHGECCHHCGCGLPFR